MLYLRSKIWSGFIELRSNATLPTRKFTSSTSYTPISKIPEDAYWRGSLSLLRRETTSKRVTPGFVMT
jgi:hypothetical protein